MYLYDFSSRPSCRSCGDRRVQTLGQGTNVTVVGGVQQLSSDASKLLQTLFTNKYPQLTSSGTLVGGAQPAFDTNADFWSYVAVPTPQEAGNVQQTVYDQLQQAKSLFLVDVNSANGAIAGSPNPVVYAIAKNEQVAAMLAGPGASLARVVPSGAAAQPTPTPTKKASSAAPVVAGLTIAAIIAIIAATA